MEVCDYCNYYCDHVSNHYSEIRISHFNILCGVSFSMRNESIAAETFSLNKIRDWQGRPHQHRKQYTVQTV